MTFGVVLNLWVTGYDRCCNFFSNNPVITEREVAINKVKGTPQRGCLLV